VGLTTAVSLSHLGHTVCAGDVDPEKVATLQSGRPTILEDGLEELLREELASGRLSFVVGAAEAAKSSEFVFLCVPTPQREDGSADTSTLEHVVTEIAGVIERDAIVVNKSTVPVGSTLVVEQLLRRADLSVVSNPEFLREGSAVHDALHPDRVVVGADDQRAAVRVGALFAGTKAPLIVTDAATAETIKYASNGFLATKLSYVNSIACLCEAVGADVRDVLLGMGYDQRIGFDYLRPGPGWGGSCLPKDTKALLYSADRAGYDFDMLRGVIEANDRQDQGRGGRKPGRMQDRRVGSHLQGRHRRSARLARNRGHQAARVRRGSGDRLRPDCLRADPRASRNQRDCRSVRGVRRCTRPGRADRVGRASLARLRQGA
jgi:UDPglucose 6-dehydrogenase